MVLGRCPSAGTGKGRPPPLSPGGSSPRSRDRGAPLGTASGVRCPLVAPRCFPGTGASPPGAEYSTIPAYRGWVDGFNPGLRACCWLRQSACLPLLLGDQPPGTKGLLRGPSLRQGASHGVVSTGLGSAGLPTQPTHPPALLPPPPPPGSGGAAGLRVPPRGVGDPERERRERCSRGNKTFEEKKPDHSAGPQRCWAPQIPGKGWGSRCLRDPGLLASVLYTLLASVGGVFNVLG